MNKLIIISFWFLSVVGSIIWSYENPEKIESLKDYFKKNQNPEINIAEETSEKFIANAFDVYKKYKHSKDFFDGKKASDRIYQLRNN